MLTRLSVVCADRIVATSSSSGVVKFSSVCASGYSSASSRLIRRALRTSAVLDGSALAALRRTLGAGFCAAVITISSLWSLADRMVLMNHAGVHPEWHRRRPETSLLRGRPAQMAAKNDRDNRPGSGRAQRHRGGLGA